MAEVPGDPKAIWGESGFGRGLSASSGVRKFLDLSQKNQTRWCQKALIHYRSCWVSVEDDYPLLAPREKVRCIFQQII